MRGVSTSGFIQTPMAIISVWMRQLLLHKEKYIGEENENMN